MGAINIVFHEIINTSDEYKNLYDIKINDFLDIFEIIKSNKSLDSLGVNIFFDDGHKDILSFEEQLKGLPTLPKLAIVTDLIGEYSYLNEQEIKLLDDKDYEICSHGCSHSALSQYGQLTTPKDGPYSNMPKGKDNSLYENQVLFQLKESKKTLENILGKTVTKFVYPYGLYNADIISLIKNSGLYKEAYTCESYIDNKNNPYECPRFLYTNDYTPSSFVSFIKESIKTPVVGT